MRKVIALSSNDWHLKRTNINDIIELVRQQCQLAKLNGLDEIICLGDVFESRISQRMDVLIGFYQILEVCKYEGVKLICIPGNHDKTDYTIEESFLKPFCVHPNFFLIEDYEILQRGDYRFHFIPYFAEDTTYQSYLNSVKYSGADVLFSHIAVQGSRNNDGTLIDNQLTLQLFKRFNSVFLGHYHNYQQIGSHIYHLPSLMQDNFGEDANKGYTLIYDDLDFEIIHSKTKTYESLHIDLNRMNIQDINQMIAECDMQKAYYRIILNGTKEQMKSIDIQSLKEKGFVIKSKEKDIEISVDAVQEIKIVKYDMDHIVQLFKTICEERTWNFEQGMKFLSTIINDAS